MTDGRTDGLTDEEATEQKCQSMKVVQQYPMGKDIIIFCSLLFPVLS